MRSEGHAVEAVCSVLSAQGCQIAARTYRSWRRTHQRVADRTISDAQTIYAVRKAAWVKDQHGRKRLTPEGLCGRRKLTALIRHARPKPPLATSIGR